MAKYKIGTYVDLDKDEVYEADGTRLTEARADQIVGEVLSAVRKRGRPSLAGQAARSPHISFRIAPELKERAEERAANEGVTLSQLARKLFERELSA